MSVGVKLKLGDVVCVPDEQFKQRFEVVTVREDGKVLAAPFVNGKPRLVQAKLLPLDALEVVRRG